MAEKRSDSQLPDWRPQGPAMKQNAANIDIDIGKSVAHYSPERVPFLRNRNMLSIFSFAHVLVGEPASTPDQVRGRLRRNMR
jgi:hypothetical protein